MTKNEVITEILYSINKTMLIAIEEETSEREDAIEELEGRNLIKRINNIYKLTEKGYRAIDTQLPYPDCLRETEQKNSIHIGHNINGSVNNSHLDISNNPSEGQSKIPTKSSTLQIIYWILGILVAIATLYKFFIK